ncbi:MAG: M28 family metallopeptidase [Gemmatimonadota bacterium]
MRRTVRPLIAATLLPLAACAGEEGLPETPPDEALAAITPDGIAAAVRDLSADSMEGRAPASLGEERTVAYLKRQFEALGLEPGNGDSWFQEVSLVSITADPDMRPEVRGRGTVNRLAYGDDFVAVTERVVDEVALDASDLVFVGYGVVAPEYGWNDYEGLDVHGKTVVTLVNDPGYATGDSALFGGRAMTYYGRWTYKYEEAARQGADGVLIVHQTGPAGYPWAVVQGGWSGPQFGLATDEAAPPLTKVEGWISQETARTIFAQAGLDFDGQAARAATREFEAVPLGLTLSVDIRNQIRRSNSRNVLARLPGSEAPDELIIYTAHWDHLGRDPNLEGDQIYNGALDNASGTAGLLAVARAFTSLPRAPRRSVLFLAVTAEEQGLLGSAYYASHPVYPLARTVATINMDGLNIWGPTRDLTVVGFGNSELDDVLVSAAEAAGRVVRPDPEPEKGFFYRSDQFEFAKMGVPSLYADPGIDDIEHGEAWGRARRDEYTAERYHKPSDEYDESWDLRGGVEDLRLLFTVGYRLATGTAFPNWREGNEFRALRDAMMTPAD